VQLSRTEAAVTMFWRNGAAIVVFNSLVAVGAVVTVQLKDWRRYPLKCTTPKFET